jgi:hypothetical protein
MKFKCKIRATLTLAHPLSARLLWIVVMLIITSAAQASHPQVE